MKYLARAAESIKARFDHEDIMVFCGLALVVYGCGQIHPAGTPISAGLSLIYLAAWA